jgi:hypothetical protein
MSFARYQRKEELQIHTPLSSIYLKEYFKMRNLKVENCKLDNVLFTLNMQFELAVCMFTDYAN